MPKAGQESNNDNLIWEGERWGSVPLSLFRSHKVSMPARLVYAYLLTYVNPRKELVAYPSQKRIASDLGCSERSVRNYICELEKGGLLKRNQRIKVEANFRGNPNARSYTLYPPEKSTGTPVPIGQETSLRSERSDHATEQTIEQTTKQMSSVVVNHFENHRIPQEYLDYAHQMNARNPEAYARKLWETNVDIRDPRSKKNDREVCPDCGEVDYACRHEWGGDRRREKYKIPDNF